MIEASLYDFAYVPSSLEQYHDLACMAMPEPWQFRNPETETVNVETPILERYICQVFRKQAISYNYANAVEADYLLYKRNEVCCFNTGLFTPNYEYIYMCFERNKRKDSIKQWVFKEFAVVSSRRMKYIQPLPERPKYILQQWMTYFDPDWSIRLDMERLIGCKDCIGKLPQSMRDNWNLRLLLETAVELSRRRARIDLNLAVITGFQGRIQYMLPLYMTMEDKPDFAIALSVMEGHYIGHSFVSLESAYQNARLIARPTVKWLSELV